MAHQQARASGAGALARSLRRHRDGLLGVLVGLALAAADAQGYWLGAHLDARVFDAQAALVRALRTAPEDRGAGSSADSAADPTAGSTADSAADSAADIVLVGLDEASLDALDVPLSLLHAPLGSALAAIAGAGPRAIGLDIALPDHAFAAATADLDRELMAGLIGARRSAPLAVALDTDARGRLRVPYAPLLAAAGGAPAFGVPLFPLDCDGVLRRYEPDPGRSAGGRAAACTPPAAAIAGATAVVPTFAARMAQQLGRPAALAQAGWLDFTRGAPFAYVPLARVLAWQRDGATAVLRARFHGRVVLVGSVLPYLDRLRLPVRLARWESGLVPPGLVANAQLLRNALGSGLLRAPPAWLGALLVLGLAALALPARPALRYGGLGLAVLGLLAGGALLHAQGWFLAPGAALLAGTGAVGARTALALASARRLRAQLALRLRGYLSPALLQALLDEADTPLAAAEAVQGPMALLFADLHDFTRRSEQGRPVQVRGVLNRYYAAITPVLHAHGGTIDNFRGDGIMVVFGATPAPARPCDAALAAAAAVLAAVERFNRDALAPEGVAPVALSIGLAYGEVLFGEVGSADRRDLTALGDAVNVAARAQDIAKHLGLPVVMTAAFAAALAAPPAGLAPLGTRDIKGHTPVALLGWTPHPPG